MTELSRHSDYDEMQREMQALRKRIEDLEERRRRPFRRWSWRWLPITAAVLLALSLLGAQNAQNKPDALFIDSNGNVGINQTKPEKTFDVNGDALFRGQLQARGVIPPIPPNPAISPNSGVVIGNSDIYFTSTQHSHTGQGNQSGFAAIENAENYNALMILGRQTTNRGRVVGMWDRLGIGIGNPDASLDVNGSTILRSDLTIKGRVTAPLNVSGEIKGKLWHSQEYEWAQGKAETPMTKVDHSVCFLTLVSGYFYGGGEAVYITDKGGRWVLTGFSQQKDVRAKARCIGAPDDSW